MAERTHPLLKLNGACSCILTFSSNFKMGPEKQTYYLTLGEIDVANGA